MAELLVGSGEHISLASLLQLLESEEITGWLVFERVARVGISEGAVVSVELEDHSLSGSEALRSLFLMPGLGRFEVAAAASVEGSPLGQTMGLIMDGLRLCDEWTRLMPMVLVVDGDVPDLLGPIASKLDGERCVLDAVLLAEIQPALLIDTMLGLLEGRILRQVGQQPEAPVRWAEHLRRASEPDPLDGLDAFECLSAGRRRLREGDLSGAESAFRRAVSLAPEDRIASQNLRRVVSMRATDSR